MLARLCPEVRAADGLIAYRQLACPGSESVAVASIVRRGHHHRRRLLRHCL
jgi:hypothetical protein